MPETIETEVQAEENKEGSEFEPRLEQPEPTLGGDVQSMLEDAMAGIAGDSKEEFEEMFGELPEESGGEESGELPGDIIDDEEDDEGELSSDSTTPDWLGEQDLETADSLGFTTEEVASLGEAGWNAVKRASSQTASAIEHWLKQNNVELPGESGQRQEQQPTPPPAGPAEPLKLELSEEDRDMLGESGSKAFQSVIDRLNESEQKRYDIESKMQQVLDAVEHQKQIQQQEIQKQTTQTYHTLVSSMGNELFGKDAGKLTAAQKANREKLAQGVEELIKGRTAMGQSPQLNLDIVEDAMNMRFSEQLQRQRQRRIAKQAEKQSRSRTGSGGKENAGTVVDWDGDDPVDNPALKKFWAEAQEEAGFEAEKRRKKGKGLLSMLSRD